MAQKVASRKAKAKVNRDQLIRIQAELGKRLEGLLAQKDKVKAEIEKCRDKIRQISFDLERD